MLLNENMVPLRRHFLHSLTVAWLLSGLGNPAMAESVSVISQFIPPGSVGCNPDGTGTEQVIVPAVGTFITVCERKIWEDSNNHCNGLGNGYRLPSVVELQALYNANPDNQMNTVYGWPTDYYYWTSVQTGAISHNTFNVGDGALSSSNDPDIHYVSCVR